VFAPKPGFSYSTQTDAEPGWLLTEVYDGSKQKNAIGDI